MMRIHEYDNQGCEIYYNVTHEEIVSDKDFSSQIKIGTPLYKFEIQRDNEDLKLEVVQVVTGYVDSIGLEQYIKNSVSDWNNRYEEKLNN